MPTRQTEDYVKAGDEELSHWPGVRIVRRFVRKHAVLLIEYKGERRKVFHPATPKCNRAGPKNHVQDIRRVCSKLGARRKD